MRERSLVEDHETSREELADLSGAVQRNLRDAAVPQLSADNRFGLAYEAALLAAKMAIACAGYRVKGQGAHHTTSAALKLVLGPDIAAPRAISNVAGAMRNRLSYDAAGVASGEDAAELLAEATALAATVEKWIAVHHPQWT